MKHFVILAVMLSTVCLSGCNLLRTNIGPKIADGVNRYCQEPLTARLALRQEVNGLIAPNSIRVNCDGDPAQPGDPAQ